jgi:hypothetical protein
MYISNDWNFREAIFYSLTLIRAAGGVFDFQNFEEV